MEFHGTRKYHSKSLFNAHWNLFGQKAPWNFLQSSMELFEQHLNNTCGSMEFHGILSRSKVPWNSMELLIFPKKVPWNSMELFLKFHGIPWNLINFIFKKIIFLNIVFGIWLMIRCYLAKISQKRFILHWFQYRNSYLNTPVSAKMAQCQRKWHAVRGIYDAYMRH